MNKNLKLLDKFDKNSNMYELICRLAERTHLVINGAEAADESKEHDPIQIVMEKAVLDGKAEAEK
ncbi:MAG: hypothetical protein JW957_01405 [Candidatus Omnitrophica bacterium]|nr:hypothetical protein [Candidatus Omnitrophota bacterium]